VEKITIDDQSIKAWEDRVAAEISVTNGRLGDCINGSHCFGDNDLSLLRSIAEQRYSDGRMSAFPGSGFSTDSKNGFVKDASWPHVAVH
jgi:hypothetical protein